MVLIHVSANYLSVEEVGFYNHQNFWLANIADSFSRISVPIFVLISGKFLLGTTDSYQNIYQKRSKRILIPLIFWTIFYLIFRVIFSDYEDGRTDITALIGSLLLGKPYYHLWYVYMLIGLYLILPFLNHYILKSTRKNQWIFALTLLLIGIIHSSYKHSILHQYVFPLWFIDYLGYFLIGYLMSYRLRKFHPILLISIYILSSSLIAIFSYFTLKYYGTLYFYGYTTPLVMIGSISIYQLFLQTDLKRNFLSKLAPLTFGVYLLHAAILTLLNSFTQHSTGCLLNIAFIGIPFQFVITLSLSFVIIWTLSRNKILKHVI